jgi:hypothetical protein
MADALTEVRFWAQVMTDAHRTVLCPPEWESRCKGFVDARGLGGLITVVASPICPTGQIVVMDTNAIEAGWRQTLQTWRTEPLYPTGFDDVAAQLRREIRLGWWGIPSRAHQLDYPLDRWEDDGGHT